MFYKRQASRACNVVLRYRGDGIDGVHDGEQEDVVDAARVVGVSRSGDFLAGGVVDEGGVASDVHLVLGRVGHGVAGAVQVLVLHEGLALFGHHDHKAEERGKMTSLVSHGTYRTRQHGDELRLLMYGQVNGEIGIEAGWVKSADILKASSRPTGNRTSWSMAVFSFANVG